MSRNAWINHQKKTFTRWCNNQLIQTYGASTKQMDDLQQDLKDGVILIQLLAALFAKRGITLPRYNKRPRMRAQKLDNVSTALAMLDRAKLNDGILKPANIVDGQIQFVLGLVWRLILSHALETLQGVPKSPRPGAAPPKSPRSKSSQVDNSAKAALFKWIKDRLADYDVEITNFTRSFRDGIAFNALCHSFKPDGSIDMDSLTPTGGEFNLNQAFLFAEKEFGIAQLLDAESVLWGDGPDERSIMTYIGEFVEYEARLEEEKIAMARLNEEDRLAAEEAKKIADEKRQVELQALRERENADAEAKEAKKREEEEEADAKRKAEAEAKRKAEAEAKRKAEELARAEALRKLAEEQEKEQEKAERQRLAEAQRLKEEEEAKRIAEQEREAERQRLAEAQRLKEEEEEAKRIAEKQEREKEEEVERQRLAEAQRLKEEEEKAKRIAEEQEREKEEEVERQRLAEAQRLKEVKAAEEKRLAEYAAKEAQRAAKRVEEEEEARAAAAMLAAAADAGMCAECENSFGEKRQKYTCVACKEDVCDNKKCSCVGISAVLPTNEPVRVCASCSPAMDLIVDKKAELGQTVTPGEGTYCVECRHEFGKSFVKADSVCAVCDSTVCVKPRCSEWGPSALLENRVVRVCATCAPAADMIKEN